MEKVYIQKTPNTPEVIFDYENGKFELSGRSIPEDSLDFYEPLMEWAEEYIKQPQDHSYLYIKLEYFNTSSSKCLLDLLDIFAKIHDSEKQIDINWYYEDILETGQDFMEVLGVDFNLIKL